MRKRPHARLRLLARLYRELGLVLALGLLILAFRFPWQPSAGERDSMVPDEFVSMEDTPITRQARKLPPPPPVMPLPVADDLLPGEEPLAIDRQLSQKDFLYSKLPPFPPDIEEKPQEEETDVFVVVEEAPKLIGGLAALHRRIEYPELARKAGIEGKVFLEFIVDAQGNVVNPQVIKGIGGGCEEEALRAIQQVRFTPGKQRGRPVNVRLRVPVHFRLR